jgi:hypothetical protein
VSSSHSWVLLEQTDLTYEEEVEMAMAADRAELSPSSSSYRSSARKPASPSLGECCRRAAFPYCSGCRCHLPR